MTKGRAVLACAMLLAIILGILLNPMSAPDQVNQSASPLPKSGDVSLPTTVGSEPARYPAGDPQERSNRPSTLQPIAAKEMDAASTPELDKPPAADGQDHGYDPDEVLRSTLHVQVKAGDAVVTGGYADDGGKLHFAVLRHRVVRQDDTLLGVEVGARLFAMAPEEAERHGLDSLLTSADDTSQHGEIWTDEEYAEFLPELGKSPGTRLMAAPTIIVLPKSDASIRVGKLRIDVLVETVDENNGIEVHYDVRQPRSDDTTRAPYAIARLLIGSKR